MSMVAKQGTLHNINGIPEDVKKVFVTAHDISPEAHIRMQAAFQRHTDNAVSKTVNFPKTATQADVHAVYKLAWTLGCKGVTIYRDGSRDEQVLTVGSQTPAVIEKPVFVQPRSRRDLTNGITERVRIGCGSLFVTVNYDDQGICEVFTNLGRAGGCPSQSEATGRLLSMALRSGVDPHVLVEQLRGIRCHSTLRQPDLKVLSCPDAIGRVLEKALASRAKNQLIETSPESSEPSTPCIANCSLCGQRLRCTRNKCPECGERLEREGGCVVCRSCGYSKCS